MERPKSKIREALLELSKQEFKEGIKGICWRKIGTWDRENIGTLFFDASKSNERYAKYEITAKPADILRVGKDAYISEEVFLKYVEFHRQKLRQDKFGYYDAIRKRQVKLIEQLDGFVQMFLENGDSVAFQNLFEHLADLHVLFDFDRALSDAIEEEMRDELGDSGKGIELDKIFDASHNTEALSMIKRLRVIKKSNLTGQLLHKAVDEVAKQYGHLGFYQFRGQSFSKDTIMKMIEDIPDKTSKIGSSEPQGSGGKRFEKLVALAQEFSQHRLQRVEASNNAFYRLREAFDKFFTSQGIGKYVDLIAPQVELVGIGKVLKSSLQPHNQTVIHISSKEIRRVNQKDAEDFIAEFSGETKQSELSGTRASSGTYKGKARVVLDPSSTKDFSHGEILVCSMTDPNYLPLMIKAGAFITEKGGILCHAAILARELGKPCLIGVKDLLSTVEDGMLIEVDCDSEKVRVVE